LDPVTQSCGAHAAFFYIYMKIIDVTAKNQGEKQAGALSGVVDQVRQSFSSKEMRTQESAIQRLGRILDNRYTVLRNLILPTTGTPDVFLIVGPAGLWVIHASALRGLFRAVGDQWEVMDSSGKNYRPARPNLIQQVLTARDAVAGQVNQLGIALTAPEAAILFVDAGAHVDMQHPAVKVVQTDAVERFAAGLLKPDAYIDPEKLRQVVDGLTTPVSHVENESKPGFSDLEARSLPQVSSQEPEFIQRIAKKTAFTRRQWILLGGLLVANIIILMVVILVAMVYVYQ
jgi:hypothetical protein